MKIQSKFLLGAAAVVAMPIAVTSPAQAGEYCGATGTITNPFGDDLTVHIGAQRTDDIICNGTINTADLGDGVVTGDKIADGSVGTDDIAFDAVTGAEIANGTVGNDDLAGDAVTGDKIADGSVGGNDIGLGAVGTRNIADNAITSNEIADGAVKSREIDVGAVTNQKLAADAVTTGKILNGTILEEDLADGVVSTRALQDGSVTLSKLGDDVRTTINDGAANALADAQLYADEGDARVTGIANAAQNTADTALANAAAAQTTANTARTEAATAQTTADTAIVRVDALGASAAAALGGGSVYSRTTGAVSAPSYMIGGQSYDNVGSAFDAVDDRLGQIDTRIDVLSASSDRRFRQANGGIATALALGGTMIVPDSSVSVNFNLATYRGEQGFSGAIAVRAAPRVYVSGGFAGSTVKGSTGGRVGVAFGF